MEVYKHIRKDTGKIFYIGIAGRKDRPYSKFSRNRHWKFVTQKTEYEVEIIHEGSESECKYLEKYLIAYYGRKNLTNMTDGGDGSFGVIPSKETRKKMSIHMRLNPNIGMFQKGHIMSQEVKDKISGTLTGKIRGPHSDEHRRKLAKARATWKPSEDHKNKTSLTMSGIPKKTIECPHCGKVGGYPTMKQWHFNKCKNINIKK